MNRTTQSDPGRLAVIWPRFGPYHVARLDAAGRLLAEYGVTLYGLEVVRVDPEYPWPATAGSGAFQRMTLLEDGSYAELARRRIQEAVGQALERLRPAAVAIPGWTFAEARAALRWCAQAGSSAILMSDSKRDDFVRVPHKEFLKSQIVSNFGAALVGGQPHSEYAADMGIPADRVFVGYDVVDNDSFRRGAEEARASAAEWRQRLGLPERYFLACCRFVPKKNLARLLEAYGLYRDTAAEPWGLVVCGDGPLAAGLKGRAAAMGLSDICWPGFLRPEDLARFYGLASAFVLPSTQDQWGLVVNEAMASGLPVLVSRTAGCRYDLVEDGRNGWLLDPFDPRQMAERMVRVAGLSEDGRRRMSEASARIIAEWGPERFARGLWSAVQAARSGPHRRTPLFQRLLVPVLTHPLLCPRKHRP